MFAYLINFGLIILCVKAGASIFNLIVYVPCTVEFLSLQVGVTGHQPDQMG